MQNYIVSKSYESAATWAANPRQRVLGMEMPLPIKFDDGDWTWLGRPFGSDETITEGHVWFALDWDEVPDIGDIVRSVHQLAEQSPGFTFEVA